MATTMKRPLDQFKLIATFVDSPHMPHDTLPTAVANLDWISVLATTTVDDKETEAKELRYRSRDLVLAPRSALGGRI